MTSVNVLLCDCGGELRKAIDFDELHKCLSSIENVNSVEQVKYLCGTEGLNKIRKAAKNSRDRLVIAACTPKLYEGLFRKCAADAGLDPSFVEIANIREQIAWPHADDTAGANDKAKLIVAAAVQRVSNNEHVEKKTFEINNNVLVIGAGVAGLQAATDIAEFGHEVTLIEKSPVIGGNALKLGLAFPTDDGAFCISSFHELPGVRKCFYRAGLTQHPGIKIQTLSEVTEVTGSFGNFEAKLFTKPRGVKTHLCISCGKCSEVCPISVANDFNYGMNLRKAIYLSYPNAVPAAYAIDFQACNKCGKCIEACPTQAVDLTEESLEETRKFGAMVIATGFEEFNPSTIKQYKYNADKDVITQLQLSRILDPFGPTSGELAKPSDGKMPESVTIIQCVGSRDKSTNSYCSKICCMFGLKHAIEIKQKYGSKVDVYFCYMDIRTPGKGYEEYFTKARELGVIFIRGKPSEINRDPATNKLVVDVEDTLLNKPLEIESDLAVLSVALRPSEGTSKLAKAMGVNVDSDGFVQELYSKLKQIETNVKGIYVAGAVQSPKDIPESVTQGQAVALRIISDLKNAQLTKNMDLAYVNEDNCDGCKVCTEVCPYNAAKMVDVTTKDGQPASVARIDETKCNRCGLCSSRCPTGAIQLTNYSDEQIFSQLRVLLSADSSLKPRIIAFCCDECGYAAVDMAGMGSKKYPPNVLPVRVPCLGWVSLYQIFKAFEFGADGVLLTGCIDKNCHHMTGATNAANVVNFAKQILDGIGVGSKRLELVTLCAAEPAKFQEATALLLKSITDLGQIRNLPLEVKTDLNRGLSNPSGDGK